MYKLILDWKWEKLDAEPGSATKKKKIFFFAIASLHNFPSFQFLYQ